MRGRVAVITGAASGFGLEFARKAADSGMKLALADVQEEGLADARDELEAAGAEVLTTACDVRRGEQVQALADQVMERFGSVHLVFNNAGVGSGGLIWENSEQDWEWVLGVNLWGVIHGVRIFTPLMLEAARRETGYEGHIVNTASMAGLLSAPTMGVYNVSKHAVVALSETLYQDLQLVGAPIGASVLCPYFVPTGISDSHRNRPRELQNQAAPTPSQMIAQAMSQKAVAAGRVSAEEVAGRTFDAIREGRFYIFSHPEHLGNVRRRMEDIVSGAVPGDPFAEAPQIGQMLRDKLRQ